MKIGIIGSGIAGLAAAWELRRHAHVTLLEAAPKLGGHVHTVATTFGGEKQNIDMGFIVCNRENYPFFFSMLRELGVATRRTTMSFSVALPDVGLEWSSKNLRGAFAQPTRLFSREHWQFLAAVLRFLAQARTRLASERTRLREQSLDEYLSETNASAELRDGFVVPLAAALWSLAPERCGEFPALTYLEFLAQHGMLDPIRPLGWETIAGGSATYVRALERSLLDCGTSIRLNSAVTSITRTPQHVEVSTEQSTFAFDRIIVACAADIALGLLTNPSDEEIATLQAFSYSSNRTLLHCDSQLLPKAEAAHASWNYRCTGANSVLVSYYMNHLQGLQSKHKYLVTLNPIEPIAPELVLHETMFRHPQFTRSALAAQASLAEVGNGDRTDLRTHYAGAYSRFGFHEDGMRSGVLAARRALGWRGTKL